MWPSFRTGKLNSIVPEAAKTRNPGVARCLAESCNEAGRHFLDTRDPLSLAFDEFDPGRADGVGEQTRANPQHRCNTRRRRPGFSADGSPGSGAMPVGSLFMGERNTVCAVLYVLCLVFSAKGLHAQTEPCGTTTINSIRTLATISAGDQERIGEWIRCEVDQVIARENAKGGSGFPEFIAKVGQQYSETTNSPAFRAQLAAQAGQVAALELPKPNLPPMAGTAIARILVDFGTVETLPGLLAGLKSPIPAVRLLALRGLTELKTALTKDKIALAPLIQAMKDAGVAETDSIVIRHVYRAMAYVTNAPEVFAAFLAVFDARLAARRARVAADGGELEAFEFFRIPEVFQALSADQKTQLVQRFAVFIRLDAQRYNTPDLTTQEMDLLERSLEAVEAILALITRQPTIINDELVKGGFSRRAEVWAAVLKWVGDPQSNAPGVLNAAPWNVAPGAP